MPGLVAEWSELSRELPGIVARGGPGPQAQALMSPRPRRGWVPGVLPENCRQAAALVLLYPQAGRPHLLLTLRRADLEDHAGQVSLPGGSLEPDEGHEQAAVRETHEEVGLDPGAVQVLGQLTSLHIPASGFHLHPVVGVATGAPDSWTPCEAEVARLIHVPLRHLADPGRLRVQHWNIRGNPALVPYFIVEELKVWGATAMVLAELLAALRVPPRPIFPEAAGNHPGGTLGAADLSSTESLP